MMIAMVLISVAVALIGVGVAIYREHQLPESISSMVYALGRPWRWLWTVWLWAVAFLCPWALLLWLLPAVCVWALLRNHICGDERKKWYSNKGVFFAELTCYASMVLGCLA